MSLRIKYRKQTPDVKDYNPEGGHWTFFAKNAITTVAGHVIQMRNTESARVPEVHHLAIANHVFLSFQAQLGAMPRFSHAPRRDQVFVFHNFGANEPALDVGVDFARGIQSARAGRKRPRPALIFADGEERDQPEKPIACTDEAGNS